MNNNTKIINEHAEAEPSSSTGFNKKQPNSSNTVTVAEESFWNELTDESILQQLLDEPFDFEDSLTRPVASKLREDENYKGFDNNNGKHWIYPINFPIRQYQFNISKIALFQNTLIVLPTGLGKTFIAAVVMYNIFRWYPMGKVIFMAPTRPLVAQQIEACCKIMGISLSDSAEMTGKQNKAKRIDLWRTKRIFFATPQVVQSDICDVEQNFPFDAIKLIVIDEAHKAKGRYAYVEVVQSIHARNQNFRILALTATPGRRVEDVGEIVQNLFISKIEVRWENCIDVAPYTHKRNIKVIKVALGEELAEVREDLINIIDPYIRNLMNHGFLTSHGNSDNISKGWIIMEQKRFREISMHHRHINHSNIATDFSICVSLYHALELLERHGLRVFINFFDDSNSESKGEKFFVKTNFHLQQFLNKIRKKLGPNPFLVSDQTMTNGQIPCIPDNLDFGHPKFDMVKKILIDHFQEHNDSRVIIFCEFRESVMLMHRLLLQNRPLIKPRIFVGQGGGTGTMRSTITQKQQLKIMEDFRHNICNTLIATCVAEEGLDVGEVDLIVCFDISTKNPTRLVQRMGRTGRKRDGKIIMMVTEGKEENLVKETLANRNKINQNLSKSRGIINCLYKYSPRLVPPQFNPICLEVFMKEQSEKMEMVKTKTKISDKNSITKVEAKRGKAKKIVPPPIKNHDVRNFFKKIVLDPAEQEIFCTPLNPQQQEEQINIIKADIISLDNSNDYQYNENMPTYKSNSLKNEIGSRETHLHIISKKKTSSKIDIQEIAESVGKHLTKSPDLFVKLKASSSTSSLLSSNDTDLKRKIRKLNSLTRNLNKPKKTNIHDYTNILETLKSRTIDNKIKNFLLVHNIKFVKNNFESMKILWSLAEDQDVEIVDKSEKQIRSVYNLITSILGEKKKIEYFINKHHKMSENILKSFITINSNTITENVENKENDNIDEWINCKLNNDNAIYSEFIDKSKEDLSKNNQSIINFEDELEISVEFLTESRYAHRFDEKLSIKAQSTPLLLKNVNVKNNFFDSSPIIRKECDAKNEKVKTDKRLSIPQNKLLNVINEEQNKLLHFDNKNKLIYKQLEFQKEGSANFKQNMLSKTDIKESSSSVKSDTSKKLEWLENDSVHCLQDNSKIQNENKSYLDNLKKLEHDNFSFGNQICDDISISEFNVPKSVTATVKKSEQIKLEKSLPKNIKKNVEISVDLFDDDFDDFITDSENILREIESKSSSSSNQLKPHSINSQNSTERISPLFDLKPPNIMKEESIKIDEYFNDSADYVFLSQSVEKLNTSLRKSKIIDKSLEMIPVDDILDIVEKIDNEKHLKQKRFQVEFTAQNHLTNSKNTTNEFLSNSQKENFSFLHLEEDKNKNQKVSDIFKQIPNTISGISKNDNFNSPSSSNNNQKEEISPSLIGRKYLNLSRLKSMNSFFNNADKKKSLSNYRTQINNEFSVFNGDKLTQGNDTIMPAQRRKGCKRLIDTDSDDEINMDDDNISSSQIVEATPPKENLSRINRNRRRRKRQKRCLFIDDEAIHSGEDSDDEKASEFNSMFVDSIVASDNEVEDDPDVNMQAKYLQSIRSPKRPIYGFKIPSPRKYMDLSKIFSQPVQQESFSVYKENSFVVSDEENVIDGEIKELDELDIAEAILKEKRKTKRLQKQDKNMRRKRILNNIFEISDDD